jgi:hypothetical protein
VSGGPAKRASIASDGDIRFGPFTAERDRQRFGRTRPSAVLRMTRSSVRNRRLALFELARQAVIDPPTQSLGRNADRRVAVPDALSGTGYFDSNITILHSDFPTFSKECEAIGS